MGNHGNIFTSFSGIVATGGDITTVGNRKIHTFTANGTFEIVSNLRNLTINVLIVAGGGAGNGTVSITEGSGGGGAGGFKFFKGRDAPVQTYAIQVGDGGEAGVSDGDDSFFENVNITTATGGGNGGGDAGGQANGANGGSGGGGGSRVNTFIKGSGITNQGNDGGFGISNPNITGGGGGASAEGTEGTDGGDGGDGGDGYEEGVDTVHNWESGDTALFEINGSGDFFAGGGGGSDTNDQIGFGTGGLGGGGDGGNDGDAAKPGTVNTGGGGGARINSPGSVGSDGGSGIVIVSYINFD